jgi:CDP-paratose 2-epimerase
MRCTITGQPYSAFGYGGKRVRENIHSADRVAALRCVCERRRARHPLQPWRREGVQLLDAPGSACGEIAGCKLGWSYSEQNGIGDPRWWISDLSAFERDHPDWSLFGRGLPPSDPPRQRGALGDGVNLSVVIPAHNEAQVVRLD